MSGTGILEAEQFLPHVKVLNGFKHSSPPIFSRS